MPRPRRPDGEQTQTFSVRLPLSLIYELKILMADPRSGRARYRTWGRLFEAIIRDWLETQKIKVP